ncbi:S1C family serine protease [Aquabacterium sp.]|uniref:S1C family serine protease n=1 Tax=Aquabacterium sp. TaxID=1872578 RepID=UPI002BB7B770|nr:S1C family serine protease [Aquabacterium sp.]HSW03326.1 S1C family serine protease [Aquabacterium sp.]
MNPISSPDQLPDSVARVAASVVGLATRRHSGAGVLWRPGVVVASASVLWRASQVALVLPDGEQVQGEVRGLDAGTDLAAVTWAASSLPVAERSSAVPRVGDFVFAVGREPSGLTQASFGHIGLVGGEWRSWRGGRIDRLIRLDGGLYPGLNGAPVADAAGQVIGIGSSAFSRHHGVVLPGATIDRVLDALLAHGRVPHGYLGIAVQPVRATLDGAGVDGLLVSSVAEDGPAAQGGLLVGDVIVSIGGTAVGTLEDLRSQLQVGAKVAVRVARGGMAQDLTLEVIERPSSRCH